MNKNIYWKIPLQNGTILYDKIKYIIFEMLAILKSHVTYKFFTNF